MGRTTLIKIIRKSIHTFLQNYNYFTNTSILALPFSASILLSSSLSPDSISLQASIHFGLRSIFYAVGISSPSQFFSIFILKLSQTISSSMLLLPFIFSFLLIAKTFIIQSLNTHYKRPSFARIFNSIIQTQLCNSFLVFSANATSFGVIFITFNCLENLKMFSSSTLILLCSMVGGITYSIVIANSIIICNMALVLSGMELKGGFFSILKACVMIRRRPLTALSLALCINIMLAGIDALFQFRVSNTYANSRTSNPSFLLVLEGLFIAYLYSIIVTLDTITSCMFYKICKIAASKNNMLGDMAGCCLDVKREDDFH